MNPSESNVSGPKKPDTEQAKIRAYMEQQRRKAETSPSSEVAHNDTRGLGQFKATRPDRRKERSGFTALESKR